VVSIQFRSLFWIGALFFVSCTIYEIELDNPVDSEAENNPDPPALVFHPKDTTVSVNSIFTLSAHIVQPDTGYAGAHLNVIYDSSILEVDTLFPGIFFTDSSSTTPLFVWDQNEESVDIYIYFLDSSITSLSGTGHIADIQFIGISVGKTTIEYDLESCELVSSQDESMIINGKRGCLVTVQ